MTPSFHNALSIEREDFKLILGNYDYLENKDHFVVRYSIVDQTKPFQHASDTTTIFLKHENASWVISNSVGITLNELEATEFAEIKKHILFEHFYFKEVLPNRNSVFDISIAS